MSHKYDEEKCKDHNCDTCKNNKIGMDKFPCDECGDLDLHSMKCNYEYAYASSGGLLN